LTFLFFGRGPGFFAPPVRDGFYLLKKCGAKKGGSYCMRDVVIAGENDVVNLAAIRFNYGKA
jgi:hypothetical protein